MAYCCAINASEPHFKIYIYNVTFLSILYNFSVSLKLKINHFKRSGKTNPENDEHSIGKNLECGIIGNVNKTSTFIRPTIDVLIFFVYKNTHVVIYKHCPYFYFID